MARTNGIEVTELGQGNGGINCNNCGCRVQIVRNASDIRDVWTAIDRMRNWVIVSSGSVLLFVLTAIVNYIISKI